jgi:vitamin B12 transporter
MSTQFIRHLTGVAGAVLCTAHAGAQTAPSAPTQLDPITVTASRTPQPLSTALGDVTVIDADTIERAGQSSLADLLQREHGIDVVTNGGPQTATSVFIRGANSGQTLFLIDGQRIGSSSVGGAGINAIALSQVERIEILRGPASGLYGADAIGGVINIITKRAQGDQALNVTGSIGLGSWNTRKADVGLSGQQGPWNYALSMGHSRSDGFSATTPRDIGGSYNPDRDGYKQDYASGRLGFAWKPGQELEASFYQSRINGQTDGGPNFDDRAIQKLESLSLASNNRITNNWLSRLRLGQTTDDSVSLYKPEYDSGRADFRTRQNLFSWQNDVTLTPNQSVSLAAERREERLASSSTTFTNTERTTDSGVAVYRGDFNRNHVQGNLRLDHINGYGSRTTGGLSYAFDITRTLQLTAGANTGFRLPTFSDLYSPPSWGGNPDLKPEKSKNVEAGLRYREGGTNASVVVYRNHVENLIQFVGGRTVNTEDAMLKGVTVSAGQQFGATSVRGSIDIADPKDEQTGQQLIRRARQVLKLAADHRIGAWRVGAEWLYSGTRLDKPYNATTFSNDTVRLGGYSLVNLTASYDITRQTQVQVRWNNITNKDYELARGYATPGSNIFVNLSYRP